MDSAVLIGTITTAVAGVVGYLTKFMMDRRKQDSELGMAESDFVTKKYDVLFERQEERFRKLEEDREERISKLEAARDDCLQKHAQTRDELARLQGRLDEQRERVNSLQETNAKLGVQVLKDVHGALTEDRVAHAAVVANALQKVSDSGTKLGSVDPANPVPVKVMNPEDIHP